MSLSDTNKVRNYKIDFLRAVSMLLIVVQHYVVWGVKPSPHAFFDTSRILGGGKSIDNGTSLSIIVYRR